MGKTGFHHNGGDLGGLCGVAGVPDTVQGDGVPVLLVDAEGPVEIELDGVSGVKLDFGTLGPVTPRNANCARFGVEENFLCAEKWNLLNILFV